MANKKDEKVCKSWKFSDKKINGPVEDIPCYEDNTTAKKRKQGSVRKKPGSR